jgi:hypothetical protein
MAGRRAHRGAVRPELRRRRRERRDARRRGLRAVPLRDVQSGQLPGPPHQHGRHLRIRLARGRLAHPARVRKARPAAHRVRRGHGTGALPRAHRRLQGTGPRNRLPRLALDSLPEPGRSHRAGAHAPGHGSHRKAHRRARARLVHRPRQPAHPPPGGRLRRLRIRQRLLRRRPALLDESAEDRRQRGAAAHRALHARRERHALRAAAGLLARRPVLPVHEGHLRRALCRGRCRRRQQPQDDEHRHALPPARAARPHHRAAALSGPHRAARPRVGLPPRGHCAALEAGASLRTPHRPSQEADP